MWTESALEHVSFDEGRQRCTQGGFGGFGDWRLPSLDELSTLYHPEHPSPRQAGERPDLFNPVQVVPILIRPPFEHNDVSDVWTTDGGRRKRLRCSFHGELDCRARRARSTASAFCVRASAEQVAGAEVTP